MFKVTDCGLERNVRLEIKYLPYAFTEKGLYMLATVN